MGIYCQCDICQYQFSCSSKYDFMRETVFSFAKGVQSECGDFKEWWRGHEATLPKMPQSHRSSRYVLASTRTSQLPLLRLVSGATGQSSSGHFQGRENASIGNGKSRT